MPPFPVAEAFLVALCAESIVYGIHAVTFTTCMRIWLHRSKRPSLPATTSWPRLAIAVSLLTLGTLHLVLTCYDNIWAFILYEGDNGPDGIFEILYSWMSGTQVSCDVFILCQILKIKRVARMHSSHHCDIGCCAGDIANFCVGECNDH